MILVFLIVSLFKKLKGLKITPMLYSYILLLTAIEILDYVKYGVTTNQIVYLIAYMFFVTYVIDSKMYVGCAERISVFYAIGTIASVVAVMLRELNEYGFEHMVTYGMRFGANTDGRMVTNFNANELGLYCCVATALMLLLYHLRGKIRFLAIAVATTVLGFLSVSRSFVAVVAVVWIVYLFYSRKSIKRFVTLFVIAVISGAVLIKVFPDITSWIVSFYEERLSDANMSSMGGRVTLVQQYFDHSFSSVWAFFLGFSVQYTTVLNEIASHNALQEMLVAWGAIGFCAAFLWIVHLALHVKKESPKCRFCGFTPFFAFFLFVQSIQLFSMHNYLVLMLVSFMGISFFSGTEMTVKNERHDS